MHRSNSIAATILAALCAIAVPVSVQAQQNVSPPTQSPTDRPSSPEDVMPRPTPGQGAMPEQGEAGESDASKAPLPTAKKAPLKPRSPLALLMKDGIPKHAVKRAVLRDDLYALLATAANAKEAKKIAAQLQRVWLTIASDTVSVLMSRASRALKAKDKKLALALLDNVVELAPDHAEVWNRRAFVHYSDKNYRAAVGDLRRALALDKNHFKALDGLATMFQQMGDDAKALKVYEQLLQVHPHFPQLEKSYNDLKRKVEGRGI